MRKYIKELKVYSINGQLIRHSNHQYSNRECHLDNVSDLNVLLLNQQAVTGWNGCKILQ